MYQQILPTVIGTLLTSLLGHFWYSDYCFGWQWRIAAKIHNQNDNSNSQILEILARFLKSFCFVMFFKYLNIKDFAVALQLILILTAGLILPNGLSAVAWESKSKHYILIQCCEQVVSLGLLCGCATFFG